MNARKYLSGCNFKRNTFLNQLDNKNLEQKTFLSELRVSS